MLYMEDYEEDSLEHQVPHVQGTGVDKLYRICVEQEDDEPGNLEFPYDSVDDLFRAVAQSNEISNSNEVSATRDELSVMEASE